MAAGCSGDDASPTATTATATTSPATAPGGSAPEVTTTVPAPTSTPTTAAPTTAPATAAPTTTPNTAASTTAAPTQIASPAVGYVVSMSWPAATEGWAVVDQDGADQFLRTTDGGATWAAAGPGLGGDTGQVAFADAADGWLVTPSSVQSTHDGGASWQPVTIPGGADTYAAVAASASQAHVAYIRSDLAGVTVASSPIDHDAFTPSDLLIPVGAGPRLDVSMSAGGPFGEVVYDDRTFIGAGEIRDGAWATWDLQCPFDAPTVAAGLSRTGKALAIACGPSGFGDDAPVVGADLASGSLSWATIEPAGGATQGQAVVQFATRDRRRGSSRRLHPRRRRRRDRRLHGRRRDLGGPGRVALWRDGVGRRCAARRRSGGRHVAVRRRDHRRRSDVGTGGDVARLTRSVLESFDLRHRVRAVEHAGAGLVHAQDRAEVAGAGSAASWRPAPRRLGRSPAGRS